MLRSIAPFRKGAVKKAIDTLIHDFGVGKSEIARALGCPPENISDYTAAGAKNVLTLLHTESRRVASESIDRLLQLGVSQKKMAVDIGRDEGTISHARNDSDRPVSARLALKLQARLREEYGIMVKKMPEADVTVKGTCPVRDAVVDNTVMEGIRRAFQAALRCATAGSSLSEAILPDRVFGAVAELGPPDLYFFGVLLTKPAVVRGTAAQSEEQRRHTEKHRLEVLIHELRDLIILFQKQLDQVTTPEYRPEDGAF